uniref:Uncharacterized protein n=2 Tax=Panagrolaimus sp. PS1159 TaxID=55785 RepID=A0AC35GR38_9BILA
MDEDNEVEIIASINKGTELITFDKAHELQYKGYCRVKATEFHQAVIISQDGEEDHLATIYRQFILVKNMLCILGPKKTGDMILFFADEERCKKIYDFVIRKKAKYKCIPPQELVLQQLYKERFLNPLLDSVNVTQNERLKEIAQLIKDEDSLVNNVKSASCDAENDIKDIKPIVDVKLKEISLPESGSTTSIDNNGRDLESTEESLPNENSSELQNSTTNGSRKRPSPLSDDKNDNTEEPPIKKEKDDERPMRIIVYPSDFLLLDEKNPFGNEKKLHIYTSSEKHSWYEFLFDADKKKYLCDGCQRVGKIIEAECHLFDGEHYVTVDEVEHICEELCHPTNNDNVQEMDHAVQGNDNEVTADDNDKESSLNVLDAITEPETSNNFVKNNISEVNEYKFELVNDSEKGNQNIVTEETSAAVQKPITPADVIVEDNNASDECNRNKTETSRNVPELPRRDFTPGEIFGSNDYSCLQPVFVQQPVLYATSTTLPTSYSDRPPVTPMIKSNNMFYSHPVIQKVQPNITQQNSFTGSRHYVNWQFRPNLVMPPNFSQPNISFQPSNYQSSLHTGFSHSLSSAVHNQHGPSMSSFNNSFGRINTISRPSNSVLPFYSYIQNAPSNSTSANSNGVFPSHCFNNPQTSAAINQSGTLNSQVLSNQSLQSSDILNTTSSSSKNTTPSLISILSGTNQNNASSTSSAINENISPTSQTVLTNSTPSGIFYASNRTMINGTVIKSDSFSLGPDKKGVANMKIEVKMSSDHTYVYTFSSSQNAYSCDKCRQKGGWKLAKLCQLSSGEICVMLDENKHICTMPYSNEILLHNGYEIIKSDGFNPFLIIFNSVNMDLGYEFRLSSNKFICKNCKSLKKHVTARLCVDQNDKSCVALNTETHECQMQDFVANKRIIKAPGYRKIPVSNTKNDIVVFYGHIHYRKFLQDSTNSFYCEGCKNGGRDTFIKVLRNQNDEEFLLVCGLHLCDPLLCSQF